MMCDMEYVNGQMIYASNVLPYWVFIEPCSLLHGPWYMICMHTDRWLSMMFNWVFFFLCCIFVCVWCCSNYEGMCFNFPVILIVMDIIKSNEV